MFETWIWFVPVAIVLAGWWWPRAGLLVFAATLPLFGAPPGGPYLAALEVSALAAALTGSSVAQTVTASGAARATTNCAAARATT